MRRSHTDAVFESPERSRDNSRLQALHQERIQTVGPARTSSEHHAARAQFAVESPCRPGIELVGREQILFAVPRMRQRWMSERMKQECTELAIPFLRNATPLPLANTWGQLVESCCQETPRGKRCPK